MTVSVSALTQHSVFSSASREFLVVQTRLHDFTRLSPHAPIKPIKAIIPAPVLSISKPTVDSALRVQRKGALKRKRYDNETKSDAILFYDDCVNNGVQDPLQYTARETGILGPNISRWANGTDSGGIPMRDHIFKAAGDLKLKKLKIGHTPESSSKYPLAEKDLSAEIRARRARGRKVDPRFISVRGKALVKQHYPFADFLASPNWRRNFLRRNNFSRRRETKRDVDYEQNEWLESVENLEKWESNDLTASYRRILMTWWAGNGYARMVKRVNINRYFEKTGCLMTVNGQGDEKINPEGLASFKFDRPVIPTVLAETPVQNHVPAVSHAELEEAVHREELSEEEVESEEDEGTDEAEKWFVPEGSGEVSREVDWVGNVKVTGGAVAAAAAHR
ncbi:hypothetical protein CYMTET_20977 [Cymbomonas tetramitiformis]|uniref:Uncharacterized protein n=1 Tax=Cymbomonas tetramitiformis TaxID=36881 RepID=A0AAE0L3Q6_9CHLO|nr:hypothetical protein CYMTET_20977 [Cymbomonas tetramitiformis]